MGVTGNITPTVGDVVFLLDDDLKKFRLGRITVLHKSTDNFVRSATVVSGNRKYIYPMAKIAHLENTSELGATHTAIVPTAPADKVIPVRPKRQAGVAALQRIRDSY